LPRRNGDALHHADAGDLDIHYDEDAYFLRATWHRD